MAYFPRQRDKPVRLFTIFVENYVQSYGIAP